MPRVDSIDNSHVARVDKLADRVAALTKNAGRAPSALRDPSGANALLMGNGAGATLIAEGQGAGVVWRDGRVSVTTEDGTTPAPVDAGDVESSGGWKMSQLIGLPALVCEPMSVALVASQGRVYVTDLSGQTNATTSFYADSYLGANYYGGTFHGQLVAASERSLKNSLGELEDSPAVIRAIRTGRFTWKDPAGTPGADHLEHDGLYVDELDEVAPRSVRLLPDGNRAPDERALIAHLIATVQQLLDRVDELEAHAAPPE